MEIIYTDERLGDYKGKIVNNSKAKKLLKWEPKVNFLEGSKKLYNYTLQKMTTIDKNELLKLDIEEAKKIWFDYALSFKKHMLKELRSEISDFMKGYGVRGDEEIDCYNKNEYIQLFLFMEEKLKNYDIEEDGKYIKTFDELFRFWPTLFLPIPDFVEEYYQ